MQITEHKDFPLFLKSAKVRMKRFQNLSRAWFVEELKIVYKTYLKNVINQLKKFKLLFFINANRIDFQAK